MTKTEFSDIIISIWEGGETTSQRKPDPREIWILADAAMSELIYLDNKEKPNSEIDGRFFTAEILNVVFNAVRHKKYITLTSPPLIGAGGSAIILISPVQDDSKQFIMASLVENFLTNGLEVDRLSDVSFSLENNTVFFDKLPSQYSQVLVRSVKAISGLGEDETIPIAEHLMNSVFDSVLQKIGIQKQQAEKIVNIYKDGA